MQCTAVARHTLIKACALFHGRAVKTVQFLLLLETGENANVNRYCVKTAQLHIVCALGMQRQKKKKKNDNGIMDRRLYCCGVFHYRMHFKWGGRVTETERENNSKNLRDHGACDINAKRQRQM